jgi:hypothetical protein
MLVYTYLPSLPHAPYFPLPSALTIPYKPSLTEAFVAKY